MTRKNTIKLNKDEAKIVKEHQVAVENEVLSLGNARQQFLAAEAQVLTRLNVSRAALMAHLKALANEKGIIESEEKNWIFDSDKNIFQKREV